jgi:hypothetical protein
VEAVRGDWNVSIRRACRVLSIDTSSYHYKPRRPGQAVLESRIREICQTRVRYGYRRVHVLLRRDGCSPPFNGNLICTRVETSRSLSALFSRTEKARSMIGLSPNPQPYNFALRTL